MRSRLFASIRTGIPILGIPVPHQLARGRFDTLLPACDLCLGFAKNKKTPLASRKDCLRTKNKNTLASCQGIFVFGDPLRWAPPAEQDAVHLPLLMYYPACFGLLPCVVAVNSGSHWIVVGGLLRLAVFDPVLNWTNRDPTFSVGSSACLDRLLTALAGRPALLLSSVVR